VSGQDGYISVKSAGLHIARKEYEYPIPLSDADDMLARFCSGNKIEKTRYHIEYMGHEWEVDVFEGDNQGLVVAEVELATVDEEVALPDWIGIEVSGDPRYLNSNLATAPFNQWKSTGHTA
jgi:CYTH domain-containing protein